MHETTAHLWPHYFRGRDPIMSSVFAWVDFAEEDRRKMAHVIDLFREEDTRDELGLGAVRDGLADLMFPGTSTIQTRARYFLFIPWLYLRHEKRRTSGVDIARKAHADETRLIDALVQGGEQPIGKDKRAALQRLPSTIYWAGLAAWRIRRFGGSQEQYHKVWDRVLQARGDQLTDGDPEGADPPLMTTWDPELPAPPEDLLKQTSFALSRPEAEYLQQRILGLGTTLLGHLVSQTRPAAESRFVWSHPEASDFPSGLARQVRHAQLFSEATHGAALLYNLMLAQESRNAQWIARYRADFGNWAQMLRHRSEAYRAWDRQDFWSLLHSTHARATLKTRRFVDEWLDLALPPADPRALMDGEESRKLIGRRESDLKKSRARLGNPRALERWKGAAGSQPLDYRWHRVRVIVADILRGLGV